MRLKMIQIELLWPKEVPSNELRKFVREKLFNYGEPLRWAITSVEQRKLKLEAVVIIPED